MNNLSTIKHAVRPIFPPARPRRGGFTLMELMVVVAILLVVSVATIPIINQGTDGRVIREAARTVAEMLSTARSRAIATGRPTGVWIDPMPDPQSTSNPPAKTGASQTLYFCEQLPPYTGDTPNSSVKIQLNTMGDTAIGPDGPKTPVARIFFYPPIEATLKQLGIITNSATPVLQGGPYYIRIGGAGPYYKLENQGSSAAPAFFVDLPTTTKRVCTISNPAQTPPVNGSLPLGTIAQLPKVMSGTVQLNDSLPGLPYQIFRGPVKTPDAPLQLPAPACVDITQSGMTLAGTSATSTGGVAVETVFTLPWPANPGVASTVWPIGADPPTPVGIPQTPVVVWFGPGGSLQKVYWSIPNGAGNSYYNVSPTAFLHLLIGRRELVMSSVRAADADHTNLIDGNLGTPSDRTVSQAQPGEAGPSGNMWVTVGAKTGLVTVAENVDPTNKVTVANSPNTGEGTKFQLGTARSQARAQQATGGR